MSSQVKALYEKRRLPLEGVQLLQDAINNGVTHPKKHERKDLLQRIHALGLTWYTDEKLKTWFNHHRTKKQTTAQEAEATSPADLHKLTIKIPGPGPAFETAAEPSSAMSIDTPLPGGSATHSKSRSKKARLINYPSIKLSAVPQLVVLADTTQEPSDRLIETWATLLKASPYDVDRWVKDHKAQDADQVDGASGTAPAAMSGSSEPTRASEQAGESDSENERSIIGFSLPLSQLEQMSGNALSSRPVVQIPPRDQLLLAIHNGLSSTSNDSSLPETASQFQSLFTPYGDMIDRFVEDIQTGKLENMGWKFNRNLVQA
ncbi:hypothetical protein J3R30DRAFT_3698702 [Lentinula aciculospora]|uniref:Homeobox domain-containing protein n=1 Tax=Lentinula aciculospora TaxID=153920 RepID=A0A9W9DS21_9AGAR|nr:hypothetical protein J3R30DRAFT_3698702 [Lentinula aciculospora]